MPEFKNGFLVAGVLACQGLAMAGWNAPAAAQRIEDVFEGEAQVLEVEVPVNVIAKDGTPIRGLQVEDFRVLEGRREQEIVAFQAIDLEILETGVSRSEIEAAIPGAARRHFLLLFDLSFSSPPAVLKARDAARQFVSDNLHPTDLAAVAIHEAEWGPRLVVTFTPDRVQLARAIDTLGAQRLLASRSSDPLRFVIDNPAGADAPGISDPLLGGPPTGGARDALLIDYLSVMGKMVSRVEKSFSRGRIFSWSQSMKNLARTLDSVKGRKHVVYFSEGWDGRLLLGRKPDPKDREAAEDQLNIEFGQPWLVDTDDIYGNTQLQNDVYKMVEEFRRADAVIQAVDISGMGSESEARARAKSVGQDALFYLAHETGGEFFEDANRFGDDLQDLLDHTSLTYLLTIRPDGVEYDGAFHPLRVKVDLPKGAQIFYRQGYYAPRPFKDLHPFEKTLLASDAIATAGPRGEIALSVLATPFRASVDQAYVPIIIEVDGKTLLEEHDGESVGVEFYAYATNQRGEMRDFFTQIVNLDVSRGREAFADGGLKYYGHLDLGRGEHLVRVLIRNSSTGRVGVQTATVSIPDYALQEAFVLQPLFVERDKRWLMVREEVSEAYQRSVVYPFTVNGEPFVPAARPTLSRGAKAQLCLFAYNLGDGALEVESKLFDTSGEFIVGGSLDLVERTITGIDGLDKFLVDFDSSGLGGGDYELQLEIKSGDGDTTQQASVQFTVLGP